MRQAITIFALLSCCATHTYEISPEIIDLYNAARTYNSPVVDNATDVQLEHAKDYARDVEHDALTTKILTEIRNEKNKTFLQKHYRLTTIAIPMLAIFVTGFFRAAYAGYFSGTTKRNPKDDDNG